MGALELARLQFGVVTVYHFFFVPITIGMAFLVAGMHTAWYRTGNETWLKLTKFFGKLFLINFAIGVVTGIVQEFQFGMNWSAYSRFVGDIFGAPLAIEALLAFFVESTFIGIWIFGWGRIPRGLHLASIWLAAVGTLASAFFILAANSWMQNPVGYEYNPDRNRAELTDFMDVLTNKVMLVTYPHVITAAFLTGGAFMAGVAMWRLAKRPHMDADAYRRAVKIGCITVLVAGVGVILSGDQQGKVMTEVQPMKMASAEALYETEQPAEFSILTIGSLDGSEEVFSITVPGLLSYLATGSFDGEVQGINDLQAEYEQTYGDLVPNQDYKPNIPVTYWTFRAMMGVGFVAMIIAVWFLWLLRKPERQLGNVVAGAAIAFPLLGVFGNSFGWIFTEMGRQPWVVFGLMPTELADSPTVGSGWVWTSLLGLTVLYAVLIVIELGLLAHYIRAGLPDVSKEAADASEDKDRPLTFAY